MFDRLGKEASGRNAKGSRGRSKAGEWLRLEPLEGRTLLTASLAPIPSVTVGTTTGFQVPLNGMANGNTDPQTYTVTTDNPTANVTTTLTSGKFWTIGVHHVSSGGTDPNIDGTMTFQLFDDLTPMSTSMIESLITGSVAFNQLTSGLSTQQFSNAQNVIYPNGANAPSVPYYTTAGNTFHRIASAVPPSGFGGSNAFIVQGGSLNGDGTGQVFATTYANEIVPQLTFNGTGQLALAHSSAANSNDSQFFITSGSATGLDGQYTIFGQLVAGASILQQLTQVTGPAGQLDFKPTNPITITSSTLSATSPDGVLHINAIGGVPNTLTNVTVTATDTVDHTTASQTFPLITIVSPVTAPTTTAPQLLPVTTPVTTSTNTNVTFQLTNTNPNPVSASNPTGATPSYIVAGGLSPGTTGTNGAGPTFNTTITGGSATVSSTGVVTVTPNPGFVGTINLIVGVTDGTNRAGGSVSAGSPANYSLQSVSVNVVPFATPPTLNPVTTPIASSVSQTVRIPLSATNPTGGQLTYTVQGAITNGAFTPVQNATAAVDANGNVTVVPNPGYVGPINLIVGVRDQTDRTATGNLESPNNYNTQAIVINVAAQAGTGAVRFIPNTATGDATGNLVVTPVPQTAKNAKNTVEVGTSAAGNIQVTVNGTVDANQPAANDVTSIIVYGSKASDRLTIDPGVTVPVLLSSGTAGKHVLTAGGGPTRQQGWYGTTVEKQGSSNNYQFGKAGKVTFVKGSGTSDVIFAGTPSKLRGNSRIRHLPAPPTGTFYKFVGTKLVKTSNPFTTAPKTTTTTTTATTKAAKK
jgi:cyclophilin family peptidyl-prolyl cis-trans isomerase